MTLAIAEGETDQFAERAIHLMADEGDAAETDANQQAHHLHGRLGGESQPGRAG